MIDYLVKQREAKHPVKEEPKTPKPQNPKTPKFKAV
jgi:hypothetical protein